MKVNLQKLMEETKIGIAELHRKTGVPLTTIKRMKQDSNANPTITSLLPIADFFSITVNQLLGVDPLPSERIVGSYIQKRELWINIPLISWQQAVDWPQIGLALGNDYISSDIAVSKNSFALIINDDNWVGFLKDSYLIIDPEKKPEHKDYIVTHKKNQPNVSFHQLLIDENILYIKSPNPEYKTKILDESYRILGVLSQIRMDLSLTQNH